MLRNSLVILLSVLLASGIYAQERVVSIYYISHSAFTNERALLNSLELARPLDSTEAAVFYLSNSDRPYTVYCNLPFEGASFEDIIRELNTKSSHEVYADVDCQRLCEIFNNIDSLEDEFSMIILNYYIDSMFWEFYNQTVIAKMYYVLDMAENQDRITMNIYFTEGDEPVIDEDEPFGPNNLCDGYTLLPLTLYE